MKTRLILAVFILMAAFSASAQQHPQDEGYNFVQDVSYVSADETDEYRKERCVLDIYYPDTDEGFATLVWFHGGGLTGGSKELLEGFRRQGFAVVAVNYRLFPKCKCPDYIDDAAQAVAWTYDNIEKYGGDKDHIYVSGHSAGGYLTLMVALAKEYTAKYGFDADKIAKAYPVSGQTVTHYTIRKERGLPDGIPVVDGYAPMSHAGRGGAPMVLISGDRDLEMLARYEENAHLQALLEHFGHDSVLYEMQGFDHGTVLAPAVALITSDIRRLWKNRAAGQGR
ncbi:MAG: alpha/beta hydrolase fold domain-containing protein [Bacteroidales bacterium]|nr:alpha/beta hydrolase fold domain-containing protein [Bacteroidales bacterium]